MPLDGIQRHLDAQIGKDHEPYRGPVPPGPYMITFTRDQLRQMLGALYGSQTDTVEVWAMQERELGMGGPHVRVLKAVRCDV